MGSKNSKAERRPHGAGAAANATAGTTPTSHRQHGEPRQEARLPHPDIKSLSIASNNQTAASPPTPPEADATMDRKPDASQPDDPPQRILDSVELPARTDTSTMVLESAPLPPPPPPPRDPSLPPPPPATCSGYGPPPPRPPPVNPDVSCVICTERFPKSQEHTSFVHPCKPCGGAFCTSCVKDMFVKACKDKSRMPPRCCNQFQLHVARPFLTDVEAAEYREKYEEWSTPNPFYCPVPTCSAFIPTRVLQQSRNTSKGKQRVDSVVGTPTSPVIACPKCTSSVCTNCRQLAHPGSECMKLTFGVDEETAALLKSWGYKKCPKCGNGIRRMYGCNHMECLCGAHFCWVCLKERNDCDGGCYESDDGESDNGSDDEQEDRQGQEDGQAQGGPPDANVTQTTEAAAQPAESAPPVATLNPDQTPPQPVSSPRRNLDAHSRNYWEDAGLDFGDEPSDDVADRAWDCYHEFETAKIDIGHALSKTSGTANMECSKCWSTIYPEIERRNGDAGASRLVSGNGIGRGLRRGFRRHRGGRLRYDLMRRDATLGSSLPSTSSSDVHRREGMELTSNNGDRVVDTYGNVIATTDFVLNPVTSPRRFSFDFDFTAEPMLKLPDDAVKGQGRGKITQHIHDTEKTLDAPFSLAYECLHCGVLVCSKCQDEQLAEQAAKQEEKERDGVMNYD
ncbi:hypothetical protein K491DRAFT_691415 [Lophiostoma macrostomum CBS 122681]|uniref:RBR-type E3 ubiquitin transferase n=1 Tax=Lophiostoma macrostomum CBS 122681 TaxID=1314788 RepID=A0A6A6TAP5_9PLEO|nr:hypothetical protein K491DRAFT_691415 [Lophiostoma macrostomum CBS 122681]